MSADETIRDWSHFEEIANRTADYWRVPYAHTAFRGHSRAWGTLCPSLARRLRAHDFGMSLCLTIEKTIRNELLARSDSTPLAPSSSSDWLAHTAILRHHGAPTRVLDWTQSPFVALYFACAHDHEAQGELWYVSADAVNEVHGVSTHVLANDGEFNPWFDDLEPKHRIAFVKISRHSRRSAAQQALFSVADDPRVDHHELLQDASIRIADVHGPEWLVHGLHRCLIPSGLKRGFLKKLWHRNVHGASLFPDMDGLCKYADDLVTLYAYDEEQKRRLRDPHD